MFCDVPHKFKHKFKHKLRDCGTTAEVLVVSWYLDYATPSSYSKRGVTSPIFESSTGRVHVDSPLALLYQ